MFADGRRAVVLRPVTGVAVVLVGRDEQRHPARGVVAGGARFDQVRAHQREPALARAGVIERRPGPLAGGVTPGAGGREAGQVFADGRRAVVLRPVAGIAVLDACRLIPRPAVAGLVAAGAGKRVVGQLEPESAGDHGMPAIGAFMMLGPRGIQRRPMACGTARPRKHAGSVGTALTVAAGAAKPGLPVAHADPREGRDPVQRSRYPDLPFAHCHRQTTRVDPHQRGIRRPPTDRPGAVQYLTLGIVRGGPEGRAFTGIDKGMGSGLDHDSINPAPGASRSVRTTPTAEEADGKEEA